MRLHLKTTPTKEVINFNYQPILTGAIHKWIGKNDVHDQISLYSFSWLMGGHSNKNGLTFSNGANWFISAFDTGLLKKLITGIQNDPEIAFGLNVSEIVVQENPEFKTEESRFISASPVLVKRTINDRDIHYTFDHVESDKFLTETLKHKLRTAGLSEDEVSVSFDRNYPKAKTKVIYYNNIGNRVNLCPVIIKGTPEQQAFAWNVGVGNSTGVGFGALN
ncbi:MAG: CRISPR-associated endoribonuclease Cas6 [Cyclobacteriaceae bacterium]